MTELLYKNALELLEIAHQESMNITDNQLGMPDHLSMVARLYQEAIEVIEKLKNYHEEQSELWKKQIDGE